MLLYLKMDLQSLNLKSAFLLAKQDIPSNFKGRFVTFDWFSDCGSSAGY